MNYSNYSMKQLLFSFFFLCCVSLFPAYSHGGTDPAKVTPKTNNISTRIIQFEVDAKAPDAPTQVKEFIEELKVQFEDQPLNIKIVGRTCDLGPKAYNHQLATQRAYEVMEMMMNKGLNIDYLEVESLGEEQPLVPNTSEQNRKKNRSVAIHVQSGALTEFLASL